MYRILRFNKLHSTYFHQVAIDDYSREKGDVKFQYGFVPTKLIIEKITPAILDYGYDSFEEWHQAYQSTNQANHTELFPIIVDDNEEEYILDGWHLLFVQSILLHILQFQN